jgi:flagellar protein FlbD
MIKVTRLNGNELVINADLVEFVEALPDTIISLVTGKKIMIKESIDTVIARVAEFKRLSSGRSAPKMADSDRSDNDG